MTALGVIEHAAPTRTPSIASTTMSRPGGQERPTLTLDPRTKRRAAFEVQLDAIRQGAAAAVQRAASAVLEVRTSVTLAGLAQAHSALKHGPEATAAAREALDLAVPHGETGRWIADSFSARIAVEILARYGFGEDAIDVLEDVPLPRSLVMVKAILLSNAGDHDTALSNIQDFDDSASQSLRGYLLAMIGKPQEAIPHLRSAVRDNPTDVDALLNLSVAFESIGAHRKAMAQAMRATRVAPGRKDLSLRYLELLLAQDRTGDLAREFTRLRTMGVVWDEDLLEFEGRSLMALGDARKAVKVLDKALEMAAESHNVAVACSALAHSTWSRYKMGRLSQVDARAVFARLIDDNQLEVLPLLYFAAIAEVADDASTVERSYKRLLPSLTPTNRAYLEHQVAYLRGDNEAAGVAAEEWWMLEPGNPAAATAAVIAVGIGQERWADAVAIARESLVVHPHESILVNNSAYVLAMAGFAREAIQLLEPIAGDDFVLKATLGLAYLADGDVSRGMALYRTAADVAEHANTEWRSLMTAYQALIVKQLGLIEKFGRDIVVASALVPVELPENWDSKPDFLRIRNVCARHGYPWPLWV